MTRTIFSVAAAAALVSLAAGCAAPAVAPVATATPSNGAGATPQAVAETAPPASTVSCQTDLDTGSHIGHHTVCKRDDADDAADRSAMDQSLTTMRSMGAGGGGGGGGR